MFRKRHLRGPPTAAMVAFMETLPEVPQGGIKLSPARVKMPSRFEVGVNRILLSTSLRVPGKT
jgi:hypothetical protein